jgi:hypothetical protein
MCIVPASGEWFSGCRVAAIGEYVITVQCVISPPFKQMTNRCFASARNAFYQIILYPHDPSLAEVLSG